jgi:hypothetical protein
VRLRLYGLTSRREPASEARSPRGAKQGAPSKPSGHASQCAAPHLEIQARRSTRFRERDAL